MIFNIYIQFLNYSTEEYLAVGRYEPFIAEGKENGCCGGIEKGLKRTGENLRFAVRDKKPHN